MKKKICIALSWLVVLAVCVVIFLLSAQNGEASAELSSTSVSPLYTLLTDLFGEKGHTVLRKIAHFSQYAALMFLMYNAFFQTRTHKRTSPVFPFLCSVLYAVSDEIHQYFVPGRACRVFDIGVDTLGCIFGGLCFYLLCRICMTLYHKQKKKFASANGGKI